jgi:hypothetical protein
VNKKTNKITCKKKKGFFLFFLSNINIFLFLFIIFFNINSYIMATSFSGGGSRSTRREPPTLGKQLVNFINCGCTKTPHIFPAIPTQQ